MSALFHSYLCGRNAPEWLIKMKYKIYNITSNETFFCGYTTNEVVLRIVNNFTKKTTQFCLPEFMEVLYVGRIQKILFVLGCTINMEIVSYCQINPNDDFLHLTDKLLGIKDYCVVPTDGQVFISIQKEQHFYLYEYCNLTFIKLHETKLMVKNICHLSQKMYAVSGSLCSCFKRSFISYLWNDGVTKQIGIGGGKAIVHGFNRGYIVSCEVFGKNRIFLCSDLFNTNARITMIPIKYSCCRFIGIVDGILMISDIGANNSDIVLYNINENREIIRLSNFDCYDNCYYVAANKIYIGASRVNEPVVVFSISRNNYEIKILYELYDQKKHKYIAEKKYVTKEKELSLAYTVIYNKLNNKMLQSPIVFLHGGPKMLWKSCFAPLLCELAEKHNYYYLSYIGSDGLNQYGWAGLDLKQAITFTKHKIKNHNGILWGESYGAFLAFHLWLHTFNYWDKLILVAPFFTPESFLSKLSSDQFEIANTIKKNNKGNYSSLPFEKEGEKYSSKTRVYIVHGKQDRIIPYNESVDLHNYLLDHFVWKNGDPILKLLDGSGHHNYGVRSEERYEKMIAKIIDNELDTK